jgi:hypothetical protein
MTEGLVFRCPHTRQSFPSGIRLDERTYRVVAGCPVRLSCPCCNMLHDFRVEQAEVDEAA